jgi:hypothetical protein
MMPSSIVKAGPRRGYFVVRSLTPWYVASGSETNALCAATSLSLAD